MSVVGGGGGEKGICLNGISIRQSSYEYLSKAMCDLVTPSFCTYLMFSKADICKLILNNA